MERVNWQRTRDILISIICIGIILWFAWGLLFGQFIHAFVLLLLSMAVAFLLTPAVNFLVKQGMPRLISTLLMYVVVVLAAFGLSYALVFSLIQQVVTFQDTVVNFFGVLPKQFTDFQTFLVHNGIPQDNINTALREVQQQTTTFAQTLASNALNVVLLVTNTFIDVLLVLVLSFYFTLDGKTVRDNIISIVPRRSMEHVLLFEDALNRVVGNYIRGQLTLALIVGVLAGLSSALCGLSSYALIIGVLAFLFETIPMVGPALASIPAILLSLVLPAPFPRTFYIVLCFIVIQMIESNVLGPRIVGHAVGLHPVASIFALIIGAQLFGAFGALLATPIVAACWVVIASLYKSMRGETADQMLARRRTPWVIRRPTGFTLRGRRIGRPPLKGAVPELTIREQPAKSSQETLKAPIRSSAIPLEHIDLLRPVPDGKEPPPPPISSEENA